MGKEPPATVVRTSQAMRESPEDELAGDERRHAPDALTEHEARTAPRFIGDYDHQPGLSV